MISSKYVECEYCVKSMSDMLLGTNISNMIAFSSTYLEASRSATKSQKCCVKLSRCELEYTIPYSGKFRGMKVSQMIFCNFFAEINFADQGFLLAMPTLGSSMIALVAIAIATGYSLVGIRS